MQQLWRLHLDWDDPLPPNLQSRWFSIYQSLPTLNQLEIPRWTNATSDSSLELHGFADASTLAYAAAVYIKVTSPSGNVTVSLLAGKSKVTPLATLTVPRLELSAAVLLSRLVSFLRDTLHLDSTPCFCWTDSTIVLTWLRSHPSRWTTFVSNRISQVQTALPNVTWRHVPTSSNPADCASRGLLGHELIQHELWWHGPPWLQLSKSNWPEEPVVIHEAPIENRALSFHLSRPPDQWDLATKFSSWHKLIRVTAFLFRFINACRCPTSNPSNSSPGLVLSSSEFSHVKFFWIKRIQRELFPAEIQALSSRSIASTSSILSLNPFLSHDSVLRVGGRLQNAPLPYDTRHPILLTSHPLTRLIIIQVHLRNLHSGLQLTLRTLRHEFWILRARTLVKSVIHQCVSCVRERAATPAQLMGNLPSHRISPPARSFTHCGLDYAGPIKIRPSSGRGVTSRKAYTALFICLASRAIHLELISDYSTAAFINAFHRFCARRGLPSSVHSDNGTTFTGADKELTAAYRAALLDPTECHDR